MKAHRGLIFYRPLSASSPGSRLFPPADNLWTKHDKRRLLVIGLT